MKEARKYFSGLGGRYAVGSVITMAVQILVLTLVSRLRPEWLKSMDVYMAVSMLPMYALGMPVWMLLVKRMPAQKVERHSMTPGQFLIAAVMCFSLMYVSNFIGLFLTTVIGVIKGGSVGNPIVGVASSMSPLMSFFIMVICAPVMEELIFRKLLVDRAVRYGQGVAVLLSGLMFGLFHGNLNQFVYAAGLGAFLAFLYVKTGNLKITIGLHMIINFFGGVAGVLILKLVDLDGLAQLQENGMEPEALLAYLSGNMTGWLVYFGYLCLIFALLIAGLVLWIVSLVKKRFTFAQGPETLPRGERFKSLFLNAGMGIYCIIWLGMIVYQLLQ